MRKPTQPGTCATCNMEIFAWHSSPGGGKRMLANGEYRDISFRVRSSIVSNNGSSMRVGFCSECADAMEESRFKEVTENIQEGVKVDVERMEFKDEASKFLHLGYLISREVDSFCGCNPEDVQRIHSVDGGKDCSGKKVVRRCCQHCFRMYTDGIDHDAVCPVIQKDLGN